MLMVVGGAGDGRTTLSDIWMLDVLNEEWNKVTLSHVCNCSLLSTQ